MLIELRAENYAVVDHAIASFGPGLNLLTGETGAGKSILVDALALLMGGKSSSELIRHGADKAVVSCVFESTPAAEAILEENGIDAEGAEIILRREILSSGKGRVFVNNQPATVTVLRQLAPELALVHAQSETLSSFDQAQQRTLLDRFAAISTDAAAEAYGRWRAAQEKLEELERGEQDRLRMVDLWSYQHKEIGSAGLSAGEDESLETEKRVLSNSEKLFSAAMSASDHLYQGASSAEIALRAAIKNIEEIARYDESWKQHVEQLESARATVNDISFIIRDYAEKFEASPEKLAEIEDRLAILDRLKRKYGKTVAEVIAFGEEVERKLAEVEDRDEILKQLRAELGQAAAAYRAAAGELSEKRGAAAARLAKLAESQINSLAMKVRFEIAVHSGGDPQLSKGSDLSRADSKRAPHEDEPGHDFSRAEKGSDREGASVPESHWSPHGWDTIDFRIATNPGEPIKPLTEIASGGEMSRVMLALKVAIEETSSKTRKKNPTPRTLVFDEIDIGIGGRAAEAVGHKLKALSRCQQILCVTHLPQIAAFADQHFLIDKREEHGRTTTRIRLLDQRASTHEVARMLSGAKVTETSLQHAAQMIAASR